MACKWIFKLKLDEDANLVRYKSGIVAQRFAQKFGTGYDEIFAPVVRQVTFGVLLTAANQRGMVVNHADVKIAYLNRELVE